jgi:alpha-N-arabinofuranosidase
MRIDLAEALIGTQPSLWRFVVWCSLTFLVPHLLRSFPGGNNLEGLSFDTRWKWNETIGP